ncbi:uncharacterized protein TrAtP1_009382 [Trichoderma atroviride]|uniref:uncharacterized protein n=1 Tax=Hypocrea atroviridis TaxID=63577 RepID=UPI0033192F40|nr:hypothetical protein TrAtP1_009382 [Trichoderma atroviride]
MGISPQITNLMIILGMMQVTKKIPFEDENVLNIVRAVYIGSNLIIAGIYFYIQLQINKKKDMTTLKYVEPAPMGSSEEGKLVTTTICAYDLNQLRQAWRGQLMGVAMMSFMHLYMKYTNPPGHSEHHPRQVRHREQPVQDPCPRPRCLWRPQATLQAGPGLHERHAAGRRLCPER